MTLAGDLEFIRKFPDKCCTATTRKGESEPCDKIAIAIMKGHDQEEDEGIWWPVCAYHTRKGRMVPLAELFKALGAADE